MTQPPSAKGDWFADLQRMQKQIDALPEPLAYIVLDHAWSPGLPRVEGRDAQGRRYAIVSPAIRDEVKNIKADGAPPLWGVPIYRREDLPEGWPDA